MTVALIAAALVAATSGFGFDVPSDSSPSGVQVGKPGAGQGLAGKVVTIDPGHDGGNAAHPDVINHQVDIGNGQSKECDTVGTQTAAGYAEHKYTFAVAGRLRRILRSHGAKVVLTRDDDHGVGPCIDRRAKIGNRAHSDAAVSIHADGGPTSGRGFHVIYPAKIHGLTNDIYSSSRKLAHELRAAYENRTGMPRADYIGRNGLDRRDDLGGLRLSDVPKVFIETGNMQNATDAGKLSNAHFRKRAAMGIYRGLATFLKRR
jgi:N-acetylmuramoyl-L-alanine amidase